MATEQKSTQIDKEKAALAKEQAELARDRAQVDEMLRKAEELIARATAASSPSVVQIMPQDLQQKRTKVNRTEQGERRVEVRLFKDGDKYSEPMYVNCNGDRIRVERGVKVMMKKKHLDIIMQRERQSVAAAVYAEEKADEFAEASRERGL